MFKMEFVELCNQHAEIAARNRRTMEYSASVRAKKDRNVKHNLTMIATFLCANTVIFYVLIDALL